MNSCRPFKKVTHVIFDMDGVILDTETLYTKATQNVLTEFGKTYSWAVKTQLMGLPGRESAKKIVEIYNLPITAEEYYSLAHEQYNELMPHCELIPAALSKVLRSFGHKYTTKLQFKVVGRPEKDCSKLLVEDLKLPVSVEKFRLQFRHEAHSLMANVALMPGACNLIKHLKTNGIPIAVATSSSKESYDLKTKPHKDIFCMFNHVVTGGSDPEVKKGKPNPDIFLVCASRFSDEPCPDKCLVFEDAPNGVRAALSAGMQVIMIPDENVPPELTKEAHVVIKCLEEAPLEKFGLPSLKK